MARLALLALGALGALGQPWLSPEASFGRELHENGAEVAGEVIVLDEKPESDEVDKILERSRSVGDEDSVEEEVYMGLRVPGKVVGVCLVLTAIAYGWFACGFAGLFNRIEGYSPFSTANAFNVAWYYWLSAFLLWVAMPVTMLLLAKDADCEGGPPDVGYIVYFCFLAAHIVLMVIAVMKSNKKIAFCDCSKDFFLWGPILIFFLILDHMDMATDAMFVGSAAACSDRISWAYQSSWEAIPWAGDNLAFTIRELGFSGLALFCFISFAYIPQLTGQTPFFALITTTLCAVIMLLTLHLGWLAGFLALVVIFGIYALGGLFSQQWRIWREACVDDEVSMALYCGMGLFEQALSQGQANERLLFVTMTRLVFENLLQLWLQTSFFSLTFHFTDWGARLKTVASMVIGLLVAASKIPGLINELRMGPGWVSLASGFNCGTFMAWVLLLVVVFYALILIWISARLCGAYLCESHMWGLTTGCLPKS